MKISQFLIASLLQRLENPSISSQIIPEEDVEPFKSFINEQIGRFYEGPQNRSMILRQARFWKNKSSDTDLRICSQVLVDCAYESYLAFQQQAQPELKIAGVYFEEALLNFRNQQIEKLFLSHDLSQYPLLESAVRQQCDTKISMLFELFALLQIPREESSLLVERLAKLVPLENWKREACAARAETPVETAAPAECELLAAQASRLHDSAGDLELDDDFVFVQFSEDLGPVRTTDLRRILSGVK